MTVNPVYAEDSDTDTSAGTGTSADTSTSDWYRSIFVETALHLHMPGNSSSDFQIFPGFRGAIGYELQRLRFFFSSGYSRAAERTDPFVESNSFVPLTLGAGYNLPIKGNLGVQADLGLGLHLVQALYHETWMDLTAGNSRKEGVEAKLFAEGRVYATYQLPLHFLRLYAGGGVDAIFGDKVEFLPVVELGLTVKPFAAKPEEEEAEEDGDTVSPSKKLPSVRRESFEIGFDVGAGVDNDLVKMSDIFQKSIMLDLETFGGKIGDDGLNFNADLLTNFFVNVRMQKSWGFGFFAGVDGAIHGNLPKSLLTLVSAGNMNQPVTSGNITASGGVFTNAGISAFATIKDLKISVKPAYYVPLMYIPKNSGINLKLDTSDGISLDADGEINVYTPFSLESGADINAGDILGSGGFDVSLEGEYALFPFLTLGATLSHIPLTAGNLQYKMKYSLESFNLALSGEDLIDEGLEFPELEFVEEYFDNQSFKVRRPLRFDLYAQYRPLSAYPELLILRPNIGFTVDITGETAYFNAGIAVQTNPLGDMVIVSLANGYEESIWKHRLGFAFNFRAFELDLEGILRSQRFENSLQGSGYEVNVGLRFGW